MLTIPREWLLAEYLLNGDSLDTSWNWYDGTATDVTWIDTDIGYQSMCGSFNGSSSYVYIWKNLIPSWQQCYFSFWVKPYDLSWWDTFSDTNPRNIIWRNWDYEAFIRFLWDKVNVWFYNWESWLEYRSQSWAVKVWVRQFIEIIIVPWDKVKCYINWVLQWNDWTDTVIPSSWYDWTHSIWRNSSSWTRYYNWELAMLRKYSNFVTHKRELYLEWLKKLNQDNNTIPELFKW